MTRIFLNKKRKGESLVEVVVALGIIAFVFSGVLTIVTLAINLNLSARQRNEAINLAANKLNNFYIQGDSVSPIDSGTCVISSLAPRDNDVAIGDPAYAANCMALTLEETTWPSSLPTNKSCDYLVLRPLVSSADPNINEVGSVDSLLTDAHYVKAESHVKYFVKGIGVIEYVVTKLMRTR